jgi:HlyD family secretion protein
VTTVQVGTQVSGTIQSLYADFNSIVKKGQVLARLDPSLFQTQIEQARANLIRSQADVERLRVGLEDANTKLTRARELSQRQLIPRTDLETAEVAVRSAQAQLNSAQAQVTQAQASLNQNQVNLQHTVIEAPIDGLVISRNVDVGQTVAASMQAPTLFVLAADLTKMQVLANLDESDVGRIRPNQRVTFRVDAYPNEEFVGTVSQVRLQPTVQQNVVTYSTVIDVPNNALKLKPGMTANVNVEIARSPNVLRVPNAALRFRPTNEMFAALGQVPPQPPGRGEGGGQFGARGDGPTGAAGANPAANAPAANAGAAAPAGSGAAPSARRGGAPANGTPANGTASGAGNAPANQDRGQGRGRGDIAARMQNMTPEQREQFMERMRARGVDPTRFADRTAQSGEGSAGAGGRGAQPSDARAQAAAGGRGGAPAAGNAAGSGAGRAGTPANTQGLQAEAERAGGATTIDALFGPLPRQESTGRVWLYVDKQLTPVRVRLGITDGQNTELVQGELQQGMELVTNVASGTAETRPAANAFPFPGGGNRGGFGGNRGGGGGGRGR